MSRSPHRQRRLRALVAGLATLAAPLAAPVAATLVTAPAVGATSMASPASQAAGPSRCPDVDGPRCLVRLSTGIRMAYVETGPRHGRPVILLHGLTDSSRSWSLAMARLHRLRPNLHIFALDQRGQGLSSMPAGPRCRKDPERCFQMSDLAADVTAFMDAKHLRRAAVAGHSMGSFVAQEVALRHPRRVSAVVLIASSTTGMGNPTLRDFVLAQIEGPWRTALEAEGVSWPEGAYDLTPLDADPDAVAWMEANWDVDPVAPPSLVTAISEETARVRLGAWIGETQALLSVDNAKRLRRLTVPTLVLWGTQDAIFYASPDQRDLVRALTRAAHGRGSFAWKAYGKVPLPASGYQETELGHNLQWEAPALVARDIGRFLRTGRPTRDLPYADPSDVRRVLVERGAARVIVRR